VNYKSCWKTVKYDRLKLGDVIYFTLEGEKKIAIVLNPRLTEVQALVLTSDNSVRLLALLENERRLSFE
jgi:hypothetical protein